MWAHGCYWSTAARWSLYLTPFSKLPPTHQISPVAVRHLDDSFMLFPDIVSPLPSSIPSFPSSLPLSLPPLLPPLLPHSLLPLPFLPSSLPPSVALWYVTYPLTIGCIILFHTHCDTHTHTHTHTHTYTTYNTQMGCIGSGLALYVPYDFSLRPQLTALESYGLRYITPLLTLVLAPIVMRIK